MMYDEDPRSKVEAMSKGDKLYGKKAEKGIKTGQEVWGRAFRGADIA